MRASTNWRLRSRSRGKVCTQKENGIQVISHSHMFGLSIMNVSEMREGERERDIEGQRVS